jgi:hypothetical protein
VDGLVAFFGREEAFAMRRGLLDCEALLSSKCDDVPAAIVSLPTCGKICSPVGEYKAGLWVVRAKDCLSTVMELLQGIEHHVDQEQEAVEKLQSLTL